MPAVNNVVSRTLLDNGRLDPELRNENYCGINFGLDATQVIIER
ncbi:MAG TPA: hypothetical protein VF172_07385 [Nitrososphaera sp.]